VAELLTQPSEARTRLSQFIYTTVQPENPLGLLGEALALAVQLEPIEKRIRVEGVKTGRITALDLPGQVNQALAAGILTSAEAQALHEYDRKVMNLIHVDDFAPHELGRQASPQPPRAGAPAEPA
ncbi:protein containing DUF1974, partial [mine drainage metagenome]